MRYLIFAVAVSLACSVRAAETQETSQKPDPICQALYDEYIRRETMESSASTIAASEIISNRGRTRGFWRQVIDGLKETKEGWDEIRYVRILGRMLNADACARESIASGKAEQMQQTQTIALPDEVVPELIDRAEKSKDYPLDAYTIALCRARDPRTRDFMLNILKQNSNSGIQFHAALGLAEIGDAAGVEWLIAHSDDDSPSISLALPQHMPDRSVKTSAIACLQTLSGKPALKTKAEFSEWWKTASGDWSPKDHVFLEDW